MAGPGPKLEPGFPGPGPDPKTEPDFHILQETKRKTRRKQSENQRKHICLRISKFHNYFCPALHGGTIEIESTG